VIGPFTALAIGVMCFGIGALCMFISMIRTAEECDWLAGRNEEMSKELELRRRHQQVAGDYIRENAHFVKVGKARVEALEKARAKRRAASAGAK
jgi:hypothetical protein